MLQIQSLEAYKGNGAFLFASERADVIERERSLGRYFAFVASEKMTTEETQELYKSRETPEKIAPKVIKGKGSIDNILNGMKRKIITINAQNKSLSEKKLGS